MKKAVFAFIAVAFLSSCPSPVLKWIDTPSSGEGRVAGGLGDKEIISFTFGLGPEVENDLPIAQILDTTGKNPISVIVSGNVSLANLKPEIQFIGESLSPRSGLAQTFSSDSPVVYTVTAKDGTTRDYGARVYRHNEQSKEIVRFAVDVNAGLTAEGSIDQKTLTITLSVPAGTDTGNLSAHVVHTGQSVQHGNQSYSANSFDMNGDFSAPGTWTVTAGDGGTKAYTVIVDREKSDARAITSFSFHLTGEEDIIGAQPQSDGKYPILVVLPETASATFNTKPPFIDYTGVSLSPSENTANLFSNLAAPVTYTVAAENGSVRDYAVRVIAKEDLPAAGEALITGFYFTNPLVQGIIDQKAAGATGTITLTVPEGTDLWSLSPEIYYRGDAVSPLSGQPQNFTDSATDAVKYKVRSRDGTTTKTYDVSVYATIRVIPTVTTGGTTDVGVETGTETADVSVGTDPTDPTYTTDPTNNNIIIADFSTHVENPVINITYPGIIVPVDISPVETQKTFIKKDITVNNVSKTVYIINPPATPPDPPVPPLSSDASIDYFCFTNPAAIGDINTGGGTGAAGSPFPITATVPYGTDLRNLTATILYTGKEIVGIPGYSPLKDGSRSFMTPVDYVVKAENDTETAPNRKYYRVTVTSGTPNTAKEITAFSFVNVPPVKVLISGVVDNGAKYPIEITVPKGTILSSLTPVITHTGDSIEGGANINTPTGTGPGTVTATGAEDFTSPIDYTVTAQNGDTKIYAVTVKEEEDEIIEIMGFYFTEPLAVGKINQDTNVITVAVPSGTNRGSLRPTVYFKGMALNPGSGAANDFTNLATYTVTGFSGKIRTYTVVVNATPSGAKDITRFRLSGVVNSNLVIGAVPDADGLYPISVEVPAGTDLASLGTEISYTGASIGPAAGTPQNFNSPQNYTVTAEDGSVKTYKVMVHTANPDAKLITSLIFNAVPLSGGGTIRVVAAIDQTGKTITATVPQTATITSLTPVITYIGKAIRPPGGSDNTANPFTDTGQNFGTTQTYTVEDQAGATAAYRVTVTKRSDFTASFEGEAELGVIASNVFDPATGYITIKIDTGKVDGPYIWYLDGVKQGASGDTFALNVGNGSLYPGRYEIMAAGTKGGLRYTGHVYFVVSGGL